MKKLIIITLLKLLRVDYNIDNLFNSININLEREQNDTNKNK